MQVLAINGSARGTKGVTHRLLDAFLAGLSEGGAATDVVQAVGLGAAPCRACLTCMHRTPGRCAQDDGMQSLYPELQKADLLVLASPVYTDGMSAQLKAVIDRCICAMKPFLVKDSAGRVRHPMVWNMPAKWVLLSTAGFPEMATFEGIKATFRAQAANFGCAVAGEFCVPGSIAIQMNPPVLDGHLGLMSQAGRELAETGEVGPSLAEQINTPPLSVDEYLAGVERYEEWCRRQLEHR